MNLGEAKSLALKLIDQETIRGVKKENNDPNISDYINKLPMYFDIAQKHIAEIKLLKKYFKISHFLPYFYNNEIFEITKFNGTDIIFSGNNSKAYHFSVDGTADVFIEMLNSDGTYTILDQIYGYSDSGFNSFKDLINVPNNNEDYSVRIRFSGNTFYNIKNVYLFNENYEYAEKIPDIARYIEYKMPNDFSQCLAVEIRNQDNYEKLKEFRWENQKTIAIDAFVNGEIRIEYSAIPSTINNSTQDDYEFELNEFLQHATVYYATALLMEREDLNLYNILMRLYQEKLNNFELDRGPKQTRVKRTFNNYNNRRNYGLS